jgi:large subunit ribosomal protein L21
MKHAVMKYAIVEHSGKQYLAQEGNLIEVDRMSLEVGKPIVFKDVLLVSDGKKVEVGAPFVKGASVKGKVQDHPKGKKITVFKYKPKQRYRRTRGHRQLLTHIEIESVGLPAAPKAAAKKKAVPKSKSTSTKATATSKTAAKKSTSTAAKKSTSTSKKKSTSTSEKKSTSKPKAAKKD